MPSPYPTSHAEKGRKGTIQVQSHVRQCFYDYFQHQLQLRGAWRQCFIGYFIEQLYLACINEGITAEWNPGNEHKVSEVLKRMNFAVPMPVVIAPTVVVVPKPKRKSKANV